MRRIATSGRGVPELVEAIEQFRAHHGSSTGAAQERRRTRAEHWLRERVTRGFIDRLERSVLNPGELSSLAARIEAREIDPYSAAAGLLARAGVDRT